MQKSNREQGKQRSRLVEHLRDEHGTLSRTGIVVNANTENFKNMPKDYFSKGSKASTGAMHWNSGATGSFGPRCALQMIKSF